MRKPDHDEYAEKTVTVNGQRVRYTDAEPSRILNPDMVLIPGFSEPPPSFNRVIKEMNDKGRRVLSVTNDHGISAPPSEHIPYGQQRKAAALNGMMKHEGLITTDTVAHSEGGIVFAGAASDNPEHFKRVVLYAPAGLQKNESVRSLILRTLQTVSQVPGAKKDLRNAGRKDLASHWSNVDIQAARYVMQGPWNSLREVLGISRAQIGDILKRLQGDYGLRISILAPEKDLTYRLAERPEEVSKLTGIPDRHIHVIPNGTHTAHLQDPEGFAKHVEHALKTLDEG